MANCFVGLPKTKKGKITKTSLYERKANGELEPFRHVIWGDWLTLADDDPADPPPDGHLRVIWSPNNPEKRKTLYVKEDHTDDRRPLEIVFVDVGQGDGAVLITPERDSNEAVMVIDAGENDKMYEFLNKRFGLYKEDAKKFQFSAAIITHPDKDHYKGFETIFSMPLFGFDKVYQSGLVERPRGSKYDKLGGLTTDPQTGRKYLQDLATTRQDIEREFSDPSIFGRREFPPVMAAALNNPNISDFEMLSTEHGTKRDGKTWMPGFAPGDRPDYAIEVVGPVVEKDSSGKPGLRRIVSNYGKTKNGHSVLLRLHIGGFRVLFGGDLNKPAEKFLIKHYSGLGADKPWPRGKRARKALIEKARETFGADVMKVCHHGASDVTDEFLQTVNPAAFVISSGDQEGHVHPRPDMLGRLGKHGRGERPVILSTELQRSTREQADADLVWELTEKINSLDRKPTNRDIETITDKIWELGHSNVDVFGSIYLKTDGRDLLVSFKKETGSQKDKWFSFHYKMRDDGTLKLLD